MGHSIWKFILCATFVLGFAAFAASVESEGVVGEKSNSNIEQNIDVVIGNRSFRLPRTIVVLFGYDQKTKTAALAQVTFDRPNGSPIRKESGYIRFPETGVRLSLTSGSDKSIYISPEYDRTRDALVSISNAPEYRRYYAYFLNTHINISCVGSSADDIPSPKCNAEYSWGNTVRVGLLFREKYLSEWKDLISTSTEFMTSAEVR